MSMDMGCTRLLRNSIWVSLSNDGTQVPEYKDDKQTEGAEIGTLCLCLWLNINDLPTSEKPTN